jgi:hypothetical protein
VTLLGIYETRSQASYHTMLKALCDLYGLRKDELDRVANEANYLANMNAARSDKERMLDFVRPGRIVEIGPGGGIVLDLLEQRFADSEVIGVDSRARSSPRSSSAHRRQSLARRARRGRGPRRARAGTGRYRRVLPDPTRLIVRDTEVLADPVKHVVQAAFATLGPAAGS